MGGFYLIDKDERVVDMIVKRFCELEVSKAGPTHCRRDKPIQIFKEKCKENFVELGAGKIIVV